jgi:hypothetical protein
LCILFRSFLIKSAHQFRESHYKAYLISNFFNKTAMKKNSILSTILAAIGAALITVFFIGRKKRKKMLTRVAEEGYETAADILYPGKSVSSKLHYGPVIPA